MDNIADLHSSLSDDLDRIKKRFRGNPRISLIVRFPDAPSKGLYLTDDTKAEMLGEIEFLESGAPETRIIEAETGPLAKTRRPRTAGGRS